jgi:hypothetical protein
LNLQVQELLFCGLNFGTYQEKKSNFLNNKTIKMAIVFKPRSNKQGVVDTSADLVKIEGRENYTVLVKDLGVFEWVSTGVVDSTNIFAGKNGFWSRVLQSAEGLLAYTAEDQDNKSTNIVTDATSDVKYPSVRATKQYADALVTGLLDDRGNFTPSLTSPGAWPTTGGSGTAGAIMKGDIWFCSASGFMGTTAVVAGASFRATVDTPGQTAGNWNVLSAGAISTSTPSLQQVTDVGATTNDDIIVSNANISGKVEALSTNGHGFARLAYNSDSRKGYIQIGNGTNSGTLAASDLTGNRLLQLPNASGTLALTADVGLPYKVYTASLVFGSGTVTATVYQNTIGNGSADGVNDISWSTTDNITYTATMSGSTAFPSGKTWIQSATYIGGNQSYTFWGFRGGNTTLTYRSIRNSDNTYSSTFGHVVNIEIRVYP